MKASKLIPLAELCTHYEVEISFFNDLSEIGLLEIKTIEKKLYVHRDKLIDVEKILRLHHDLNVNIEGIDIIFALLQKLEAKENEVISIKNKLGLYEL